MKTRTNRSEIEALRLSVESLAACHGWTWDDGLGYQRWNLSSMGSRYTTLQRSRDLPIEEGEEWADVEYQTLKVRVSNHATAYCSEDISIVPPEVAGGDDHSLARLEKILAAPFVAD